MLPRTHNQRDFGSYASVDGAETRKYAARRAVTVLAARGEPTAGAAGSGAAGASVDIAALAGRDVVLAVTGRTYFRFDGVPTASVFHFVLDPGSYVVHIQEDASTIAGYGDGGAWAFCLTPLGE